MARTLQIAAVGIVVLAILCILFPLIWRGRVAADRANCQNHLREIGLLGVRHAVVPGEALPPLPRDELPPGTFKNEKLTPEQRMSWYIYTLAMLDGGAPNPDPKAKSRRPVGLTDLVAKLNPSAAWNEGANLELANYRMTTGICPAQVPEFVADTPVRTNYIALGGRGVETPALSIAQAGRDAGAYRYDGWTPDKVIRDGLRQTAQFIETNFETGPWLQGGPATLRGVDVLNEPYLGERRPFGGCHPGGAYVSLCDGSTRFLNNSIDPAVFRALLTIAGDPDEASFEGP